MGLPGRRIHLSSPLRRRRLLRAGASLLIFILIGLAGWDHLRPTARAKDDWTVFDHKPFLVTRVVDGDTIHVRPVTGGDETIVRLVGIDAPELHDPATGKPAHWAERASQYLQARATNQKITLTLEPIETRDRYGRLLAYVYLNESDCLNIDLIRDGQAYADRRFRHTFRPQYEQAENEARKKQRGLWQNLTEDEMPTWRRVWLHERE